MTHRVANGDGSSVHRWRCGTVPSWDMARRAASRTFVATSGQSRGYRQFCSPPIVMRRPSAGSPSIRTASRSAVSVAAVSSASAIKPVAISSSTDCPSRRIASLPVVFLNNRAPGSVVVRCASFFRLSPRQFTVRLAQVDCRGWQRAAEAETLLAPPCLQQRAANKCSSDTKPDAVGVGQHFSKRTPPRSGYSSIKPRRQTREQSHRASARWRSG
jgi:hypothetical protein